MHQVKHSPDIDTDKPVSRQHEMQYFGYYGYYPYYWGAPGLWGGSMYPGVLLQRADQRHDAQRCPAPVSGAHDDPHLRSYKEVTDYNVQATDGSMGHVKGLLVDAETWAIRYIVVHMSNWCLGHEVLVASEWIQDVSWAHSTMNVALTLEAAKTAPRYDATSPPSREQEDALYEHYGRVSYWEREAKLMQSDFPCGVPKDRAHSDSPREADAR
jgi:hypothetical protein